MFGFLLLIVTVLMLAFFILMLVKNDNALKNRGIIIEAIYEYNTIMIASNKRRDKIKYADMESYDDTLYRWWDWGYENILPPDKFEIIKPYIKNNRLKRCKYYK